MHFTIYLSSHIKMLSFAIRLKFVKPFQYAIPFNFVFHSYCPRVNMLSHRVLRVSRGKGRRSWKNARDEHYSN